MPPTIFKNPKVEFENNMRKKYASPPTIVLISTGPCDFCNQGELHPLNIAKKSLWSAGECHPINFCNHPPPWVFIIYTVFSSVCGLNLHHHWSPPPNLLWIMQNSLSWREMNLVDEYYDLNMHSYRMTLFGVFCSSRKEFTRNFVIITHTPMQLEGENLEDVQLLKNNTVTYFIILG